MRPQFDTDRVRIDEAVEITAIGDRNGEPAKVGYVDRYPVIEDERLDIDEADRAHAADGTELMLVVRGTPRPARVAPLPFVPHRYKRN